MSKALTNKEYLNDALTVGYTPTMAGCVGDGITDDTVALQAWANSLYFKVGEPKTFKVSAKISFPINKAKFDGRGMIVDGSSVNGSVLEVVGTLTAIPDMSASPAAGAVSLSFASAHTLNKNDVGIIYNSTNSSWSTKQTYYRAGEFFKAAHISSTTSIKMLGGLYAGYDHTIVDMYKMSTNEVFISNLTVYGKTSGTSSPLKITLATKVRLYNVAGLGSDYTGINLDRCYDVTIDASTVNVEVQAAASKYGISIGNSQHVRITGSTLESVRHSINIGGDDFVGCVPWRDVWIMNCYLASDPTVSLVNNADVHGNGEIVRYVNCTIKGGASFGGKDVRYWNCDFDGYSYATGAVIYGGSEWLGGVAEVNGGRIKGGLAYSFGMIRLFTDATTSSDSTLIVKNVTVEGALCDTFARCDLTASTYKVNARIEDITFISMPSLTNVLRMVGTGSAGDGDFVVVDGITGGPSSGINLYLAVSGYGSTVKCKLMEQSGTVAITPALSGNSTAGTSVSFRYQYGSKAPVMTLVLDSGTINSKTVVPYVSSVSEAGFGANLRTFDGSSFGATPTVNGHWTASLAEI